MSEREYQGPNRRENDSLIIAFREQMRSLHTDLTEVKAAIKDMAVALNKLTVVEERQNQTTTSIERAFSAIEKLGVKIETLASRVIELEKQEPMQQKTSAWVEKALWAAATGFVMLAASKLGLM